MSIIGIEFDQEHFKTIEACERWLASTDHDYLLKQTGFRLRFRRKGLFISFESRPVFSFYNSLWKFPALALSRPDPFVLVMERRGGQTFQLTDIPPLLKTTVEKQNKTLLSQQKKKQKQKEYRESRKSKDKEKKRKAESLSSVDGNNHLTGQETVMDVSSSDGLSTILI